jgi:hypothetical protein
MNIRNCFLCVRSLIAVYLGQECGFRVVGSLGRKQSPCELGTLGVWQIIEDNPVFSGEYHRAVE